MKVGDKVRVSCQEERRKRLQHGRIAIITKHYITVQFKNHKESFKKTDILAKGWVDMDIWNGREWQKVDKEVMNS